METVIAGESLRKPKNFPSQAMHSLGDDTLRSVTGQAWVEPTTIPAARAREGVEAARTSNRNRSCGAQRTSRPGGATGDRIRIPAKRPVSCAEWLKLLVRSPVSQRRRDRRSTGYVPTRMIAAHTSATRSESAAVASFNSSLFDSRCTATPPNRRRCGRWWSGMSPRAESGFCSPAGASREPSLHRARHGRNRVTRSLPVRVVRVRKDTLGHWVHGCEFLTPLDDQELATVFSPSRAASITRSRLCREAG